jgi:protein kinase C substrate 80K-H
LSKEELGRLVASRWTGEDVGKKSVEANTALDNEDQEDILHGTNNEENEGYASETDDDTGKYDDDTGKYDEDINDEEFQEDEHEDLSSSYKSDVESEPDLSGLL